MKLVEQQALKRRVAKYAKEWMGIETVDDDPLHTDVVDSYESLRHLYQFAANEYDRRTRLLVRHHPPDLIATRQGKLSRRRS